MPEKITDAVLVVGGGVAGMQAALDLATAGCKVYLVDRAPAIGGLMAQLDTTFPTDDCQMCLLAPREEESSGCLKGGVAVGRHPNIEVLVDTEVLALEGEAGNFTAVLEHHPRYIDPEKCTACGDCAQVCPVNAINIFNAGLDQRRAAYLPFPQAVPRVYAIDRERCNGCSLCAGVCQAGAVNYANQPSRKEIGIGAVVLATGNSLFQPGRLLPYLYGQHPNVITSLEFERLLSGSGPTQGRMERPSDHQTPRKIAWLQCIGSRDVKTHTYCSSVCCMYALKEAVMAKKRAEVDAAIFYMDMRTFGKGYEEYLNRVKTDYGVRLIRYRVPALAPGPDGDVTITYRDSTGTAHTEDFNLVVLSVGFEVGPGARELAARLGLELNAHNYVATTPGGPVAASRPGVYVCGTLQAPKDIPHSLMEAGAAAASCLAQMRHGVAVFRAQAVPAAPPGNGQPPRIGVFVCDCGNHLPAALDLEAVRRQAASLPQVVYVAGGVFPCFPAGLQKIARAIQDKRLNRVVVAGCSPLTHETVFQKALEQAGLNKYLLEMANIRNQAAWVYPQDKDQATRKAHELVRQAVARAAVLKPLAERGLPMTPQALVVGGGIAGLSAALNLAEQGFGVYLVEKQADLGGLSRRLHRTIDGLEVPVFLDGLIRRVEAHDNIEVLRETVVTGHRGAVGDFITTVAVGPDKQPRQLAHGVAILATGGRPLRPRDYHYGVEPGVLTQLELGELLHAQPGSVQDWERVIMIQCVGSRQANNPRCSRICCQSAIKHALELKALNPKLDIIILHRDLRMYGFLEDYYLQARDQRVLCVGYEPDQPPRVQREGGKLQVSFMDPILGRPVRFPADAVVLSAAVMAAETADLAQHLNIPRDDYGFWVEAHPKMRPVDGAVEGFFLCGLAHSPQLISEAVVQAQAAAARAGAMLAQTARTINPIVAQVTPERCAACLACVRTCPYGVPFINDRHRSEINPARCRGCGVCAAVCPAQAIDLAHYQDDQLMVEIEA